MHGWKLKIGAIYSGVEKSVVQSKLSEDKIVPCGDGPPPLTKEDIDLAKVIVAQIGAEPFMELLSKSLYFHNYLQVSDAEFVAEDDTIDVFISGRSYDPAPFAAFAMHHGVEARKSSRLC